MVADPSGAAPLSDAYAALGVDPTASADDVRRAYRRLARELHPDANPGDAAAAERFRLVAEAHDVLADPIRRARYDVVRGHAMPRTTATGPRPVRRGPAPSGNAAVRGPSARPSHRPLEVPASPPRPETDEWSFLARFARWAGVVIVVVAIAVMVLLLATPRADPAEIPNDPRGVPGGAGFCLTPDGWVSCHLVEQRGP